MKLLVEDYVVEFLVSRGLYVLANSAVPVLLAIAVASEGYSASGCVVGSADAGPRQPQDHVRRCGSRMDRHLWRDRDTESCRIGWPRRLRHCVVHIGVCRIDHVSNDGVLCRRPGAIGSAGSDEFCQGCRRWSVRGRRPWSYRAGAVMARCFRRLVVGIPADARVPALPEPPAEGAQNGWCGSRDRAEAGTAGRCTFPRCSRCAGRLRGVALYCMGKLHDAMPRRAAR